MKPFMKTPVSFSIVLTVHSAPSATVPPACTPWEKAALNLVPYSSAVVAPSLVVQLGTSTVESRGIEIISIRDRSPEMCMTIVVSDRAPASSPPRQAAVVPAA